jgi:hypothetical protein
MGMISGDDDLDGSWSIRLEDTWTNLGFDFVFDLGLLGTTFGARSAGPDQRDGWWLLGQGGSWKDRREPEKSDHEQYIADLGTDIRKPNLFYVVDALVRVVLERGIVSAHDAEPNIGGLDVEYVPANHVELVAECVMLSPVRFDLRAGDDEDTMSPRTWQSLS